MKIFAKIFGSYEKIYYLCSVIKNKDMKNVNLTGIYLGLIAICDVTGFDLSSMRKNDSKVPSDALMEFHTKTTATVNVDEVTKVVKDNITNEVRKIDVKVNQEGNIVVYIEFMESDWNDDYAYPSVENQSN